MSVCICMYSRAANYAYFLTSEVEEDGSVLIWKAEKKKDDTKVWTVSPGSRCQCQIRIDYDFQCGHELVFDGRFIVDKYNKRWLNNYYYYEKYPENSPFNISFYSSSCQYDNVETKTLPMTSNQIDNSKVPECSQDIIVADINTETVTRKKYHILIS